MATCHGCGAQNEEGARFCGACGEYLGWDTPVAPGPPVVPERIVVPVQPAEAVPRHRPVLPVEPQPLAPGETRCAECHAANPAGRRFCRRCAAALVEAPAPPSLTWWQRVRRWWSGRGTREAGFRPTPRRPYRLPVAAIAALAALLAVAMCLGPARPTGRQVADAVRDRLAKPEQIDPVAVRASSTAAGLDPTYACDGLSNRFWAPMRDRYTGEWVEADLPRAARLLNVVIYAGASAQAEQFRAHGRPSEVEVTATDRAGGTRSALWRIADRGGKQEFRFAMTGVVRVRLTIRAVRGTAPGGVVALGEVEFFVR